MTVILTKFTVF